MKEIESNLLIILYDLRSKIKEIQKILINQENPQILKRSKPKISRKSKSIEEEWNKKKIKRTNFLYNQLSDIKLNQIKKKYANLSTVYFLKYLQSFIAY